MRLTTSSRIQDKSSSSRHDVRGSTAAADTRAFRRAPTKKRKALADPDSPRLAAKERTSVNLPVSHEQIAALAYELWQQRGGTPEHNWFEAESRLRARAEIL